MAPALGYLLELGAGAWKRPGERRLESWSITNFAVNLPPMEPVGLVLHLLEEINHILDPSS